jgi:CRISPR-associated protein Cst1
VAKGRVPLVGLDAFVTVFEDDDGVERTDWMLSRDLVLIRLIEELHRQGWFSKEPGLLAEVADAENEDKEESN